MSHVKCHIIYIYIFFTITESTEAYKEACTEFRKNLVKGRQFKDSQNRQITILDVPKQKNRAIEVEVTTLSNKPNEKGVRQELICGSQKRKVRPKLWQIFPQDLTICLQKF